MFKAGNAFWGTTPGRWGAERWYKLPASWAYKNTRTWFSCSALREELNGEGIMVRVRTWSAAMSFASGA